MRHLRKRLVRAAAAVAGLVVAGMATAGQAATYQYQGQTFLADRIDSPITTAMSVSGEFSLAGPLASSQPLTDIYSSVTSFSFFNGVHTLTDASPNLETPIFEIATDANGKIESWRLLLVQLFNTGIINTRWTIMTTSDPTYGDLTQYDEWDPSCCNLEFGYGDTEPDIDGSAIINPSNWSVVPLPAAFPLFGTGLGLLGFLGWRRRRKAEAV